MELSNMINPKEGRKRRKRGWRTDETKRKQIVKMVYLKEPYQ